MSQVYKFGKKFRPEKTNMLFHVFLLADFKSVARFPPSGHVSEIIDVGIIEYS